MVVPSSAATKTDAQLNGEVADKSLPSSPTSKNFVEIPFTTYSIVMDILRPAIPCWMFTVLGFVTQSIVLMYIGQYLTTTDQAYYSVALSFNNMIAAALTTGLSTALDTLMSQAYGRDKETAEIGELLQRYYLVCGVLSVPIALLYWTCEPLLVLMFGSHLGTGAAGVLVMMIPYMLSVAALVAIQKALMIQELEWVPLVAALVSVPCCVYWCQLWTPSGVGGAIAALIGSMIVQFCICVAAYVFHPKSLMKKTVWPIAPAVWSTDAMKEFLTIGVAATVGLCSEIWSFEGFTILLAHVSQRDVDGFSIFMSMFLLFYSLPFGLSFALGICTGKALGEFDPKRAQAYSTIGVMMSASVGVCDCLAILMFGDRIFQFFSKDKEVIALLHSCKYLAVSAHIFDCLQTPFQGIFRGVGLQDRSARRVVFSLWVLSFGTATFLVLRMGFGLSAALIGLTIGLAVLAFLLGYESMFGFDWEALAVKAAHEDKEKGDTAPKTETQV